MAKDLDRLSESAIIGWYRMGASFEEIGFLGGISAYDAEFIVTMYFVSINFPENKKQNWFQRIFNKYVKTNP